MHDVYIKGEKKKEKRINGFIIFLIVALLLFSIGFFVYSWNPLIFETQANIEKSEEIYPDDSLVINFSKTMLTNYSDFKIEIFPKVKFGQQWENHNRKLVIYPEKYWPLETDFRILINGKSIIFTDVDKEISFRTISYPQIVEFNPDYGKQDVLLDIEDPIKAVFDSPIDDFKVKFTVNPFKELDAQLDSRGMEIRLMPKQELERGERYDINIFIRYKKESESEYRKIHETFFETKPLPPPVWDKDFAVRIEQAKKFTEPKIKDGKCIDVNLKSQVMVIFEDGNPLDAYIISSGKRGMDTPEGDFTIHNKTPRAWSKKYGLYMPYWMAIVSSGDFGIHELPEWPGGYKEGQSHLGTPVSHGCIRLGVGAAERVYSWTEIGTPVIIHH